MTGSRCASTSAIARSRHGCSTRSAGRTPKSGCHERAAAFNRLGTELAREAVDLGLIAGAPELYANAAINLAGNLIALGDLDGAAEQLARIQTQYETDTDPWMSWRWSVHLLDAQARLALAQGDLERALGVAQRELDVANRAKAQKLIARAHELKGRLHLLLDDRDAASEALETALAISHRIEHPSVAWRARSLLAELADRAGDADGARRHRAAIAKQSKTSSRTCPSRACVSSSEDWARP